MRRRTAELGSTEFCDIEKAQAPKVGPAENKPRTASAVKMAASKPLTSQAPCHSNFDPPAANLIGGERTGPPPDPEIVEKIFAAELGDPAEIVVSSGGIVATVTPLRWRRS